MPLYPSTMFDTQISIISDQILALQENHTRLVEQIDKAKSSYSSFSRLLDSMRSQIQELISEESSVDSHERFPSPTDCVEHFVEQVKVEDELSISEDHVFDEIPHGDTIDLLLQVPTRGSCKVPNDRSSFEVPPESASSAKAEAKMVISVSLAKVPLRSNQHELDMEFTCTVFDETSARITSESGSDILIMDGITLTHEIEFLQIPLDPGEFIPAPISFESLSVHSDFHRCHGLKCLPDDLTTSISYANISEVACPVFESNYKLEPQHFLDGSRPGNN